MTGAMTFHAGTALAPRSGARVWFVTGASSGIGLAICRHLRARDQHVIATGRRDSAALPADFPDIPYIRADLSDPAARAQVLGQLPGALDFALLNAGIGYYRPLTDETDDAIAQVLHTNLHAPIAMAAALYPALLARSGVLGLVGSVAYRKAAGMPVYAASKAGLDGFGRSLHSEWQGRVQVRVIHPGPTDTGMAQRAGLQAGLAARLMLPPDDVAARILAQMQRPGGYRRVVSFAAVLAGRVRAALTGGAR